MVGRATPRARGRWLVLGVAVALALLVVVGHLQQGDLASHRPVPVPVPSTTTARPLPVTATIGLGASPASQSATWSQLMVGEGRLWVVLDGVLVGVDPRRPIAVARIRLGQPGDFVNLLAVGAGAVWVGTGAGGRLVVRVRLPSASSSADVPSQLVIGEGAVWVLTSVESPTRLGARVDVGLVRIDPHTNRVSTTTPLADLDSGAHQVALAVGAGGVWVEGQRLQDGLARAVIDRVDPVSGRLRGRIETGDPSPAGLAAGFGALWLLRPGADALLRLEPAAM